MLTKALSHPGGNYNKSGYLMMHKKDLKSGLEVFVVPVYQKNKCALYKNYEWPGL